MKLLFGLLSVLGFIGLWVCGLGVLVSMVAWVCSLLGASFITGAGTLFFKFAAGWLLSALGITVGYMGLHS